MTTKTNATHTPGPWHTAGTTVYSGVPGPRGNGWVNSRQIAACAYNYSPDRHSRGEDEANARLIAAAPDYADLSETIHLEINGMHATMRATSIEYRGSALCRAMDELIRRNAAILAAKGGAL